MLVFYIQTLLATQVDYQFKITLTENDIKIEDTTSNSNNFFPLNDLNELRYQPKDDQYLFITKVEENIQDKIYLTEESFTIIESKIKIVGRNINIKFNLNSIKDKINEEYKDKFKETIEQDNILCLTNISSNYTISICETLMINENNKSFQQRMDCCTFDDPTSEYVFSPTLCACTDSFYVNAEKISGTSGSVSAKGITLKSKKEILLKDVTLTSSSIVNITSNDNVTISVSPISGVDIFISADDGVAVEKSALTYKKLNVTCVSESIIPIRMISNQYKLMVGETEHSIYLDGSYSTAASGARAIIVSNIDSTKQNLMNPTIIGSSPTSSADSEQFIFGGIEIENFNLIGDIYINGEFSSIDQKQSGILFRICDFENATGTIDGRGVGSGVEFVGGEQNFENCSISFIGSSNPGSIGGVGIKIPSLVKVSFIFSEIVYSGHGKSFGISLEEINFKINNSVISFYGQSISDIGFQLSSNSIITGVNTNSLQISGLSDNSIGVDISRITFFGCQQVSITGSGITTGVKIDFIKGTIEEISVGGSCSTSTIATGNHGVYFPVSTFTEEFGLFTFSRFIIDGTSFTNNPGVYFGMNNYHFDETSTSACFMEIQGDGPGLGIEFPLDLSLELYQCNFTILSNFTSQNIKTLSTSPLIGQAGGWFNILVTKAPSTGRIVGNLSLVHPGNTNFEIGSLIITGSFESTPARFNDNEDYKIVLTHSTIVAQNFIIYYPIEIVNIQPKSTLAANMNCYIYNKVFGFNGRLRITANQQVTIARSVSIDILHTGFLIIIKCFL